MQREYIWLDNLRVAMMDDTGSSPVLCFIHTDQLGSPQKMTDANANVVWDGVYDPFGIAVSVSSLWGSPTQWGSFTWEPTTPETMNLRFPGQYYDAKTALNQNWFRDYDATIGRYNQSDPIGLRRGPNTYNYVGSAPLGNIDPFGLWQITVSGGGEFGGIVTFGHNSGQWNFGAWGGVGEGFSFNFNPFDAGCHSSGFNSSLRAQRELRLGPVGGEAGVQVGSKDLTFNGEVDLPNNVRIGGETGGEPSSAWEGTAGSSHSSANASVGFGASAVVGWGGQYFSEY